MQQIGNKHEGEIKMANDTSIAVFGGGCFWCVEAVFQALAGVTSVTSGYSGGHVENPSYQLVCSETTGHAEVTRIEYNSIEVSYEDLLTIFFSTHDPTTLNRQGADVGTRYRSVIMHTTSEQKSIASQFISKLDPSEFGGNPIVTQVEEFKVFYEAEDYHKDYYLSNPEQMYCQFVISPKVAKLQSKFGDRLKSGAFQSND